MLDPLPLFFFIIIFFLHSSQSISRLIFLDFQRKIRFIALSNQNCVVTTVFPRTLSGKKLWRIFFFFSFSCKDSEVSAFLAELQLFLNKSPQDSCALPHILPWLSCQGLMPLLRAKTKINPLLPEHNTVSKILAVCFLQSKCNSLSDFLDKYWHN